MARHGSYLWLRTMLDITREVSFWLGCKFRILFGNQNKAVEYFLGFVYFCRNMDHRSCGDATSNLGLHSVSSDYKGISRRQRIVGGCKPYAGKLTRTWTSWLVWGVMVCLKVSPFSE